MESLTPIAVERKLTSLVTELTRAQQALAAARDAETDAEIALRKAKARAYHHPDCPKVTRGGYTVGDRDAFVEEHVQAEWATHRLAVTAREVAADNLRTVRDVAEVVRSLGASVRTAYDMAGRA